MNYMYIYARKVYTYIHTYNLMFQINSWTKLVELIHVHLEKSGRVSYKLKSLLSFSLRRNMHFFVVFFRVDGLLLSFKWKTNISCRRISVLCPGLTCIDVATQSIRRHLTKDWHTHTHTFPLFKAFCPPSLLFLQCRYNLLRRWHSVNMLPPLPKMCVLHIVSLPCVISINHHEKPSITINHHRITIKSPSITMNHHQLQSITIESP